MIRRSAISAKLSACKWKKLLSVLLFAGLIAEGCQRTAEAAFDDTGTGARPTALGGTYVVQGDDAQSLMVNPAGLAQLHAHELTSEYSRLYSGLTDGSSLSQYYAGYAQPIKYGGTIGVGWKQFQFDNLYQERTLSLGYGEWITKRVAAGLAIKQLHVAVGVPNMIVDNNGNVATGTPDFYAQNGSDKSALSADIGTLVKLNDRHTLGFSVQDVNEPNIALSNADHDIVPKTVRIGWGYRAREGLSLLTSLTERKTLAHQNDYTWTGAAEKWWTTRDSGDFALRGSLASGSREFQQVAFGAGYRLSNFQIDYAFVFNVNGITLGQTAGTHRFSASFRFGSKPDHSPRVLRELPAIADRTPAASQNSAPNVVQISTGAVAPVAPSLDEKWIDDLLDLLEDPIAPERQVPVVKTLVAKPKTIPPTVPAPVKRGPRKPKAGLPKLNGVKAVSIAAPISQSSAPLPWTYTVQEGDTLVSVAKKFYGNTDQWHAIYEMNSDRLGRGGDLTPGQVLFMPKP